jgi:hypothetical protein
MIGHRRVDYHLNMASPLVVLVGHCGPDTSYLRMAVQKALPGSPIRAAHDEFELDRLLASIPGEDPQPILLVNRSLEPGFEHETGVELIAHLHRKRPLSKLLLVSNFPEAQEAAIQSGARPGFGKRDIGSPKVITLLQDAAK